jgi:periplasmic divalent cation tolerance protein
MAKLLEVSTATPTRESAIRLAESAVTARLAAGGQISGPVVSVFWHEGQFGTGEEWVVTLKTTSDRYTELEKLLVQLHEWSNPEVTATVLERASAGYSEWLERVTRKQI